MDKTEQIKNYVIEEFEKSGQKWFVGLHLNIVEKFALELEKTKNANLEVIKLSVWLHDIYYSTISKEQRGDEMTGDYDKHEIFGAEAAEKIMSGYGYNEDVINAVEECILTHRCKGRKPESLEAKILASADAMSHIENFSMLLFIGFAHHGKTMREVYNWLNKKIERDWNEKILFQEAKEMIKEKYKHVRAILDEMKKLA